MRGTFVAVGVALLTLSAAFARADIVRWDSGQVIDGTEGIVPGPGVDLSRRALSFAKLEQLDLSGADFTHSSLRSARLNGSNLSNAELWHTNLDRASLAGADLSNADISLATLTRVTQFGFAQEQLYSTFSHQAKDLSGINLSHNNLSGWDFRGQKLFGVFLAQSNVSGADFTDAQIGFTLFNYSSGVTKEQIYSTASYKSQNMQAVGLQEINLSGWDFHEQDLSDANLADTPLNGANFEDANITRANFGVSGNIGQSKALGLTKEQIYSTANYKGGSLTRVVLGGRKLISWDFAGLDLTNTSFFSAELTDTDFTGAIVTSAGFGATTSQGFTKEQLYSTASYQHFNLEQIDLTFNDLSSWNFRDQYLARAFFQQSTLTNTDFTRADLRGATNLNPNGATLTNAIGPDGIVHSLALGDNETLRILDFDADPFGSPAIPMTIEDAFSLTSTSALRLVFDGDAWDSVIRFEPELAVELDGRLSLEFAAGFDVQDRIGETFKLFDWTAVTPTGSFDLDLPAGTKWDVSQLYSSGEVKLTGVPEPSSGMLVAAAFACAGVVWRRR